MKFNKSISLFVLAAQTLLVRTEKGKYNSNNSILKINVRILIF